MKKKKDPQKYLWSEAKAVLGGKYIALIAYYREEKNAEMQ